MAVPARCAAPSGVNPVVVVENAAPNVTSARFTTAAAEAGAGEASPAPAVVVVVVGAAEATARCGDKLVSCGVDCDRDRTG